MFSLPARTAAISEVVMGGHCASWPDDMTLPRLMAMQHISKLLWERGWHCAAVMRGRICWEDAGAVKPKAAIADDTSRIVSILRTQVGYIVISSS